MFLNTVAQFWSEWGLRVSVLSSLGAHGFLVILSGARRHSAPGWWAFFLGVVLFILWVVYQIAEVAASSALGKLSLSVSDASSDEHQLIAFWAPLLLLHLGGPDNITAYALEDNKLNLRKRLEMILQVMGAFYVLYKYIYHGDSKVLLAASFIMFAAGVAKYVERAWALWRANMDNMRSSSKKQQLGTGNFIERFRIGPERKLNNGEALLLAHNLFYVCQRAMVDSSVEMDDSPAEIDSSKHGASKKIFSLGWSSMCKVVEMELSLMYDVLYTKATVIHTRPGYIIRLVSPLASTAATWLFWFYRKDPRKINMADVKISYLLLGAAILLDLTWLLRALGSTWTYAFFKARPRAWLHRAVVCHGCWRRLHRFVLSLDPLRLIGKDPISYRLWSGTIGRYNLLHECSRGPATAGLCRRLATMVGLEDAWKEIGLEDAWKEKRCLSELSKDVKKLLFQRTQLRLSSSSSTSKDGYTMKDITTSWGHEAVKRGPQIFAEKEEPFFGHEFQEDILVWHVGTCIFLWRIKGEYEPTSSTRVQVKAIEEMSEYLMFLVAVRRHMLPGLALRSLLEVTRQALDDVWDMFKTNLLSSRAGKEKLAEILHKGRMENNLQVIDNDKGRLVLDGTELAGALIKVMQGHIPELLELIFDVWVDKLLYAGTQCSRESHANQLSRGGELTTILWIMVEHAGPFRIGEKRRAAPEIRPADRKPKPDGEKGKAKPAVPGPDMPQPWAGMPPPWARMPPYPPPPYPPYPQPPYPPYPQPPYPELIEPDEPKKEDEPIEPKKEDEPDEANEFKRPIRYATLYPPY